MHTDTKASPPTPNRLFPVLPERELWWICKLNVISQQRLKTEVNLLLSANMESYMPRRLAQQRMTLSDLEWPFHDSSVASVWEGRAL